MVCPSLRPWRAPYYLAIAAHQDGHRDRAIDGVLQCYQNPGRWFTGVIVTNGAGPARAGVYANFSSEQMVAVRGMEQKKAALIGDYGAQILLDYSSAAIKDSSQHGPVDDLCLILEQTRPEVVYTHNLADKHPTHVAVALRAIQALRALPQDHRPGKVYGCEVWRDSEPVAGRGQGCLRHLGTRAPAGSPVGRI
jgi:LmbE family N-acetylglucosaminyl deacetylase